MIDEYYTIDNESRGTYKEKGSKFLSYLYYVSDEDKVEEYLHLLKKEHPKSGHVCYSYRLGVEGENYRINDDGEPSGTAGRPIHNELLSGNLTYVLLAVVRYWGGTKLGASGLIRAYKTSSKDAISECTKIKKYVEQSYKIVFNVKDMGRMYNSLKYVGLSIIEQENAIQSSITVGVRLSKVSESLLDLKAHFHGVSIDHASHDNFKSDFTIEEI